MTKNVKLCERCKGAVISNIHNDNCDYYRHISVKYCDTCREIVKREQTAERMRKLRARRREENKARDKQLELLKKENELLKENIDSYALLLQYIDQARKEVGTDS